MKTYDCGPVAGHLTAREIAKRAEVSLPAVYARIGRGVTGTALLVPDQRGRHAAPRSGPVGYRDAVVHTGGIGAAYLAAKIATRWPGVPPPLDGLQSEYGMSKATAYRWRMAFADAYGVAA